MQIMVGGRHGHVKFPMAAVINYHKHHGSKQHYLFSFTIYPPCTFLYYGWNPQPEYVPYLGIKPATFGCMG